MHDKSNKIDSTVKIIGDVKIGKNNVIHPFTVLIGPLEVGDDNIIGPNVVIGSPGQDTRNPRYDSSQCRIKIGSGCIIREFTAIQKPCYEDLTFIGNEVHIMQSVHIPHDAHIYDGVVLTPMVAFGGIVRVMEYANVAVGCSVHQRIVIGSYAIAAMGAPIMKNIKPFSRYIPGKSNSINEYAIKKYGFEAFIDEINKYVVDGTPPHSKEILEIVSRFENLHRLSGKSVY